MPSAYSRQAPRHLHSSRFLSGFPWGPKKGLIRKLIIFLNFFLIFSPNFWVVKLRFLAFSEGPGGFRELREAGKNHFHLSWYLSVAVVTSSDPRLWWVFLPKEYVLYVYKRTYCIGGALCRSIMCVI